MDNGYLNSDGRGTYDLSWVKMMSSMLRNTDALIPNSWLELKSVQSDLNWDGNKYGIAPYGVDPKTFGC